MIRASKTPALRSPDLPAALVSAALLCAAAPASSSLAQNALGDGRALDANLQHGSGGRNAPGRDFASELALRNAIVTGNVGGGKAFRGNLGYSAADDFRAALGSNDLFSFNRDAAYSGLAAQNLRGIGALQFQFGQSTAGMTRGLGGDLIIRRTGTGLDSAAVAAGTSDQATASIDPFGHLRQAMRSTSEFVVRSSAFPRVLAGAEGHQTGTAYTTASPLQGIKVMGIGNSAFGFRPQEQEFDLFVPPGAVTKPPAAAANRGEAGRSEKPDQAADVPELSRTLSKPISLETAHQRLLDEMRVRQNQFQPDALGARLSDRPDADPGAKSPSAPAIPEKKDTPGDSSDKKDSGAFDSGLKELRDEFARDSRLPWQRDEERRKAQQSKDREQRLAAGQKTALDESDPLAATNDAQARLARSRKTEPELVDQARSLLGSAPAALETLIAEEGTSDLYTIHMRKGQSLLEAEQWFAAEERFGAALSVRPGDAMAATGRVSAEIGAGLYRSAVVNLRTMLSAYPELLQTRLDPRLFPSGQRLERIRAQLRIRAERDTPLARDAGFLLAFIGSQTAATDDLRDGFAVMDRVNKALGLKPDSLEAVARGLWTGR